jgi:hypothetical protein
LITYKAIVDVSGVSANDIYSRSRECFATAFNSANNVLQMDDRTAGKLIGKGVFHTYLLKAGFGAIMPINYVIGFTVNISIKEAKYRVIMPDFKAGIGTGTPATLDAIYQNSDALNKSDSKMNKQVYNNLIPLLKDVDTDSKTTIANLQKAVTTKVKDDF